MRRSISLATVFALGCGGATPTARPHSAAECKPVRVEVHLAAGEALNGTSAADARPVQVRVYQLRSEGRIKTASFEDVWQHDKKTLADDLVGVQETTSYPAASSVLPVTPKEGAEFMAVVALFREPEDPNWLVVHPLPAPVSQPPCPKGPMRLSFDLDRMQIADAGGGEAEGS